jgi:hypothetical protein
MSEFMQPQVVHGKFYEIETNNGTWFVPVDVVGGPSKGTTYDQFKAELLQYTEASEVYEWKVIKGWGARLSAPGYMDCTEWSVYSTETEAWEQLDVMYDAGEDSEHYCQKCGQAWAVHNSDGGCIDDNNVDDWR